MFSSPYRCKKENLVCMVEVEEPMVEVEEPIILTILLCFLMGKWLVFKSMPLRYHARE